MHFLKKCIILSKHRCRCDGMVDVVDSKSTAGDSVPVRVRPPAPRKERPQRGRSFLMCEECWTRTNLDATVRGTVAHARLDGHDTLIFLQSRKMQIESVYLSVNIRAPQTDTGTIKRAIPFGIARSLSKERFKVKGKILCIFLICLVFIFHRVSCI